MKQLSIIIPILALWLLVSSLPANSQSTGWPVQYIPIKSHDMNAVYAALNNIRQRYKDSAGMAFTIKMLAARESTPSKYIDSIVGCFKVKQSSLYSSMNHITTIQNDSLCISVYTDDSLIVAGLPAAQENHTIIITDWDTAFIASNIDTAYLSTRGKYNCINFVFSKTSYYYNCSLEYDSASYLLHKIKYTLAASKVPETGTDSADGVIITLLFKNYKPLTDTMVFSTDPYVTVTNGVAQLQPAYAGFQLIQNSSLTAATTSTDNSDDTDNSDTNDTGTGGTAAP